MQKVSRSRETDLAKRERTNRVLPDPTEAIHSSASDPLLSLGAERVRDVACGEGRLIVTAESDVGRGRECGGVEREGSGVRRGKNGSARHVRSSVRILKRIQIDTTHPRTANETSLTQSSEGRVLSS